MVSKILKELDIISKCQDYRLKLWQCPHFIFLLLGVLIMITLILAYFLGQKYIEDPTLVIITISTLAVILMTLNYLITHSFEKLAEISKMRADFIHIVSHQLRTPLSNFKWGLEALFNAFQKNKTQEQVEYIDILRDNTKRMLDLVSELLTIAKLEEGRLPIKFEKLDFKLLVVQTLKRYEAYLKAANVKADFETQDNLFFIKGDQLLLQQVLECLLDNAIKYGGKHIKISLIYEKSNQLKFKIEDDGQGILPEEQKYLFKKFFRGENAKKIIPEGTGLGLFIAKNIIERHKGTINFSPNKPKGSIFWFTLPLI